MTGRQRLISTLIWVGIFEAGYWAYWAWSDESFSLVVVAGIFVLAMMTSRLYDQRVKDSAPLAVHGGDAGAPGR
jgi:hypothetical protein